MKTNNADEESKKEPENVGDDDEFGTGGVEDDCEVFSCASENLPSQQLYKVYPYFQFGSLRDLITDQKSKSQKYLVGQEGEEYRRVLHIVFSQVGMSLCDTAQVVLEEFGPIHSEVKLK